MPRTRPARPRSTQARPSPAARKAALAMLRRFDRIRDWKDAVHKEAWRQAYADGSRHCHGEKYEAAGARLEAAGVKRPPEAWFAELKTVLRLLAEEDRAPAEATGPDGK